MDTSSTSLGGVSDFVTRTVEVKDRDVNTSALTFHRDVSVLDAAVEGRQCDPQLVTAFRLSDVAHESPRRVRGSGALCATKLYGNVAQIAVSVAVGVGA